jgi:hypothetical protein
MTLTPQLREQVRLALMGDSNDAEHDALVAVAGALNIEIDHPEWIIVEHTRVHVTAPTAQEALDRWLHEGEKASNDTAVDERHVEDQHGNVQDVIDP